MCFHPIKIRNPSLYFNVDIDKPFIEVPCGHCEQCRKNKITDLVVRSYYQWQQCKSNGGFAFFDTLTYSNPSVPRLFDEMIFSRDDLTKFFKRLRRKLDKQGYRLYNGSSSNLTYLVTTEYGTDNTKRPHYHIIWFCQVPGLTLMSLYKTIRQVWTYDMQKGWNDKISAVMSHCINRLDGIEYVVKYLSKQTEYAEKLKSLLEYHKDNEDEIKVILKNIKNIKPFYRSSIGYGASIMELDYKQLHDFGVPVYSSKGLSFLPIPNYIKRKLFYDKVPHPHLPKETLFKRNSLGIEFLVNHLDEVLDAKTLMYKNILDNENIYTDDFYNLKSYITEKLGNRSIRDFVTYKCVYKGHAFSDLSWYSYKEYYQQWLTQPRSNTDRCIRKELLKDYVDSSDFRVIADYTSPDFESFDEIDDLFDILLDKYNSCLENSKNRKSNELEKTQKIVKRFTNSN